MGNKIDIEAEKLAVRQTIDDSIKWPFPEKDIPRLERSVAQDENFFIFHPDSKSTIVGYPAFQKMIDEFFTLDDLKPLSVAMSEMRINLSQSGDVAWFSCLLDDRGEFRGKVYHWQDCRWTGVLEKRDGLWKIVQMHFSLPSDAPAESTSS